jgi:hypothetical protein
MRNVPSWAEIDMKIEGKETSSRKSYLKYGK